MYHLLNDNTENGLEGPEVWAAATHQWNKIPTYQPHCVIGCYTYSNASEALSVRIGIEVDYFVELSERQPLNTSSVTLHAKEVSMMKLKEAEIEEVKSNTSKMTLM